MKNNIFVKDYKSILNLKDTEIAIKVVKDYFEKELAKALKLTRVSAPIFVNPNTGLNDNLNGVEEAVNFICRDDNQKLEIVHSLAKWKRHALKKYNFKCGQGLYTDMNAIRACEDLDNIHSLYVDQWDWEKIITKKERNIKTLKNTVKKIYHVLKKTGDKLNKLYPDLDINFPNTIKFISTKRLEKLFPKLSRKERENEITKKYGAVFLIGIGNNLKDGKPHDGRAPDYDDWLLNGDILIWNDVLNIAFEISSMGIRVDSKSLIDQLRKRRIDSLTSYHTDVINDKLPYTIGGGIGQSRICMLLLKKCHIGEVQCSYWSEDDIEIFEKNNVHLL